MVLTDARRPIRQEEVKGQLWAVCRKPLQEKLMLWLEKELLRVFLFQILTDR